MNNWQLDVLREQMDTKAWDELNAPDPCEKQMKASARSLIEASQFISMAESRLADGMAEVFDTPMELKIGSLLDALQDLRCDIFLLAEKYRRGER